MINNIRLLVMPPHASHLLQQLDLACLGPMKTYLSRTLWSVVKSEARQIQRHEWFCAYAAARPLALRKPNIASGFRRAGLFPFALALVLQRLPAEGMQVEQRPSCVFFTSHYQKCIQWLQQASPASLHMRQENSVVRRMLVLENPIERPARSYQNKVVDRMEQLQAELTITIKELEGLKSIVRKRAQQRAGKRKIIKNMFLISIGEVRDLLPANLAHFWVQYYTPLLTVLSTGILRPSILIPGSYNQSSSEIYHF